MGVSSNRLDRDDVTSGLRRLLKHVSVLARRLVFETQSDEAQVARMRGVWGAALHALDRDVYESVFHSPDPRQLPGYILRPIIPSPVHRPAFDFILIGAATQHDETVLRAWDVASGMGLGRDRQLFILRERDRLRADGTPARRARTWTLADLDWPLNGFPHETPCRLHFATPLSLLRQQRLIESPTIKDIVAKGCRRLGALLPGEFEADWQDIKAELIDAARDMPAAPWVGIKGRLPRYSASQDRDFNVPAVQGHLDLPSGSGPLWPLLAALQWLHVGKSTNIGLGWLQITAIGDDDGTAA